MIRNKLAPLLILASVLTAACEDESPVGNSPDGGTQGALTYWGDVAPIFAEKCLKCHQEGGIAPFRLDTYADASKKAAAIIVQTESKLMPPFLVTHDGSCGQFEAADTLSDAEIAKIKAWASGELREGTKVALTVPKPPGIEGGIDYKTPTLAPMAEGGKLAEYDEYRCFMMDPKLEKDRFITGYDVLPGNAAIVHHALVFLIDPNQMTDSMKTNAQVIQALDAGENGSDANRIGWPCFGLAGQGVKVKSVPVSWAPGQGPVRFPDKMGVLHAKSDLLVIQIHYNLADPKHHGESDSTTVRFSYADTVERKLIFLLSDGLLETLGKNPPDIIPARTAAAPYTWKKSVPQLGLEQLPYVDLVGIMPHMHQRGRKNKFEVIGGDGAAACQAKVDRWDFTWQKFYFYKTPPRLDAKSHIQVSCEYDTSKDEMPVLPGWGTRNEMCLDVMMLALPPGI
jgi:hypothetical protein